MLHGTGDDDKKSENWMRWIPDIAQQHNDMALVLPGVASSQAEDVGQRGIDFLARLKTTMGSNAPARRGLTKDTAHDGLLAAITEAGGNELPPCTQTEFASGTSTIATTERFLDPIIANARPEKQRSALGIKYRIAVAGAVVACYVRTLPSARPIRIIGHSRGGAAAVGLHNLLTLWNINCSRTLTLDPCHGQDIVGNAKDYYTKVWKGTLRNIPCESNVGDSMFDLTRRPPIAAGGNADVTNEDKLPNIKHGHMGKMSSTHTTRFSLKSTSTQKREQREAIATQAQQDIDADFATLKQHLEAFFDHNLADPDLADKRHICTAVVTTLTGAAPPPYPPN